MSYRITEIKVETIEKKNGDKEYLVWAVDNIGRDWRIEPSGHYGEGTELKLGKTHSFRTSSNKEKAIANIKFYIDRANKEAERWDDHQVKSTSIETIKI